MKQTRLGTAVLVCLLSSATAFAVDRNVSNQTQLNSAIAAAAPGDNIILANGTYSGLNIDLTCSGSSSAPITLRAATAGSAIINGDSRVRLAGSYLVVSGLKFTGVDPVSWTNVVLFDNADYSRLTQCAFYQCGKDKWTHIVKISNGTTNARVDHNYMEQNQGQGIGIAHNGGNSDNQIDHNHINRIQGDAGITNGYEPIQLGQGGYDAEVMRALVEYNLLENLHQADSADPEMISVKTGYNTIRYNTFRNNDADRRLVLRSAVNCTVEGNFLLGCGIIGYGPNHKIINNYVIGGSDGIHLPGGNGSNYANTYNCLIANNTVINPINDGIEISGDGTGGGTQISNITVKNNLVQGGSGNLYYQRSGLSGISYANNLGFNNGNATVSNGASVALTSNPNLVNDGTVYRLPSGASPAKDAGTAVTEVTQDMDGQARTGTLDIGADEYSTAAIVRRPLTSADVNPAWLGGPPADDGSGADAAPVTAVADTYAAGGNSTTNYGTDVLLGAKEDGTTSITYDRIAFLKFDLSSLASAPTTATLVLATDATTEGGTVTANQVTTDSWTETGLTWSNKPAYATALASATVTAGTGTDVAINVTSFIQSQFNSDATKVASIALTGNNAKLWFKSRESGTATAPTLVFTGGGASVTPDLITSVSSVTVPEGSTATFGVKLASTPAANVTVTVARSGGDSDISVSSGATLTFTSANWNTYQNVTLAAAEDTGTINGVATITVSAAGADAVDVTATESDNDPAPLAVSEDTYVAGGATTTNYGGDVLLGAKEDGTASITYDRIAYVNFDLSTLTALPTAARLELTTDATTEGGTVTANQVGDTWSETGVSWSTKPATGSVLGSAAVTAGTSATLSIDVTSYVQSAYAGSGTVSIALTGTNAKLWFKSREAGSATAPRLMITGGGL